MCGETSGPSPRETEKAPELESTQARSASAGAGGANDLVEAAFAILAEEEERWRSARAAKLRPESSS